jgi:hypothetical protein
MDRFEVLFQRVQALTRLLSKVGGKKLFAKLELNLSSLNYSTSEHGSLTGVVSLKNRPSSKFRYCQG